MSITNQRKHQLGFCTVCLHRKLASDFVLKCDLTKKVAQFETECPTFSLDIPTIVKRRITQEKKVLDRFHPPRKFLDNTRTRLTTKNEFSNAIYKTTQKRVFRESDQSDIGALIVSIITIIGCFIFFIINPQEHIALLIAFIAFISSCFFGYRILAYDYKVQLKITEYGLETPRKNIPWSAIMDYYLSEKKHHEGDSFYTLVILTSSGVIKKIRLNFLEVRPETIIKKINQERKLYYHDSY